MQKKTKIQIKLFIISYTFNPPLSLLRTKVAKASLSTSSLIIKRGAFSFIANSKNTRMD